VKTPDELTVPPVAVHVKTTPERTFPLGSVAWAENAIAPPGVVCADEGVTVMLAITGDFFAARAAAAVFPAAETACELEPDELEWPQPEKRVNARTHAPRTRYRCSIYPTPPKRRSRAPPWARRESGGLPGDHLSRARRAHRLGKQRASPGSRAGTSHGTRCAHRT
jgi:hypothetical protein